MSFAERFLRYPGLFPARLAGEPWGDAGTVVEAPGGPYRITDLDPAGAAAVAVHFRGASHAPRSEAADEGPGAVTCRVLRMAREEFLPIDTRGWELTLDLEREGDSLRIAGLGLVARLEWRPRLTLALWTDSVDPARLPGTVENVLRVAVAHRLAEEGGALLHAAAVAGAGGAAAFLGRSGAGKTTLARLCLEEGLTVLGDDLVAVVWRDGAPWLQPLPFGGDLRPEPPLPAAAPLAGLYRLAHGQDHAVADLGHGQALATLLACSPYVNRDPLAADRLLEGLARLLESVPVRLLTFARRPGVWTALAGETAALPGSRP
jgi:hypothetical protein